MAKPRRRRGNGQGSLFKRTADGCWIMSYYDSSGQRRERSTKTKTKAVAERVLAEQVNRKALVVHGLAEPDAEQRSKEAAQPIAEHVEAFRAKMETQGRSAKHIKFTVKYVRFFVAQGGWASIRDIDSRDVDRAVQTLRKEKGVSDRTVHAYLTAVAAFTRWLVQEGRLRANPLVGLKKPSAKRNRKFERRALQVEEWPFLRRAAEIGPVRGGLKGPERALVYAVALQTGLRVSELRALMPSQMWLSKSPCFIRVKACQTKNAKPAKQYLNPDVAEALRQYLKDHPPEVPVFPIAEHADLAEALRADLADARTAWLKAAGENEQEKKRRLKSDFLLATNHAGERLDFHALRHTCGAWLAMKGVSIKVVQTVMRHSTITLTMDTYGHLFPGQESDAIAVMPRMAG